MGVVIFNNTQNIIYILITENNIHKKYKIFQLSKLYLEINNRTMKTT